MPGIVRLPSTASEVNARRCSSNASTMGRTVIGRLASRASAAASNACSPATRRCCTTSCNPSRVQAPVPSACATLPPTDSAMLPKRVLLAPTCGAITRWNRLAAPCSSPPATVSAVPAGANARTARPPPRMAAGSNAWVSKAAPLPIPPATSPLAICSPDWAAAGPNSGTAAARARPAPSVVLPSPAKDFAFSHSAVCAPHIVFAVSTGCVPALQIPCTIACGSNPSAKLDTRRLVADPTTGAGEYSASAIAWCIRDVAHRSNASGCKPSGA